MVILEQVEDNCLHNKEIRFLVESLNGNLLDERTMRMKEENEWLRFTQDEGEIYLKGWECRRAQHTLKKTYGLLFAAVVPWDTYKIPVNIVSVVDKVDIKALPMYVSTGDGPGFMVNNRVFNIFRRWRTKYSPEEAGLEEIGLEEGKGERLLEEEGDSVTPQLGGEIQDPSIEAEPVKPRRGWNEEDEEEKRSGSPELAKLSGEKEKEVRRNDVDEEESQSQQGETPVVAGGTDKPRNPGSSDS